MSRPRVVVAITGASGAAIGVRIVERLAATGGVEIHLVVSSSGRRTLAHEAGPEAYDHVAALAHVRHDPADIGASIASGSFSTAGMIVAPCSMRTLASIATGFADTLVQRAADVHLKERRPLILLARETPLHLGHLRNMCAVTEMGAVVMPPVPAFYRLPQRVEDIVDHLAARAIDQLRLFPALMAEEWPGI